MPRISVVLIVRDEAPRLSQCLEAARRLADEIVVLDTGSTDNTPEIARRFTDSVHVLEWRDDFSAARNAALDLAQCDYVLSLDADEIVDAPEAASRLLREFAERRAPHVVGAIALRSPTSPEPGALVVVDHLPRFFRRGQFRYEGAIHEQLCARDGRCEMADTGVSAYHTGYMQRPDDPSNKARRNMRLLTRELERNPDDEYLWHQLGKAHYTLREYAAAAAAFEHALDAIRFEPGRPPAGRLGPVARSVLTDVLTTLAYAYVNLGRPADAARLLEQHRALAHAGTRRADFHHALGYVYLMLGILPASESAYRASLALGAGEEDVLGTGSFSSLYHLGLLAEAGGDLDAATAHHLAALAVEPCYRPALARLIDFVVEYGRGIPPDLGRAADVAAARELLAARIAKAEDAGASAVAARLRVAEAVLSPEKSG